MVYIIDDDESVRSGFARVLEQAGHCVEVYGSAEEFLRRLPFTFSEPTCAVLDLVMPGVDGMQLQSRLNQDQNPCSIVFVSGNARVEDAVRAMHRGAITFLSKPVRSKDLQEAVAEGLARHGQMLATSAQRESIRFRIASLSEREHEAMGWMITGAPNKLIASEMGISERTVKAHRKKVYEKMKATSVAEIIRLCDAAGVAPANHGIAILGED